MSLFHFPGAVNPGIGEAVLASDRDGFRCTLTFPIPGDRGEAAAETAGPAWVRR
jgi:hypothetical protein